MFLFLKKNCSKFKKKIIDLKEAKNTLIQQYSKRNIFFKIFFKYRYFQVKHFFFRVID